MFSRLFWLIAVLAFSYLLIVFALPTIADQYWDPILNAKIRNIKDASLQFASGSDSASSLVDKIKNTATPYIDDTKKAVEDINTTVTNKVNQVQEASIAVQSAYSGVIDAKNKIGNLTGTGR
jgi:methyl-accepting chemotaxis protein